MDSLTDFKLVIETNNIIPMPSLSIALHCCISSYCIYNIVFPLEIKAFMLFHESYVCFLKRSQKLHISLQLFTALRKYKSVYAYYPF